MRRTLATALLLAAPACTLYVDEGEPTPGGGATRYQLVPRGNLAAPGPVAAIGWDGREHLLVLREEVGDFYTPDRLSLVRLDPAGAWSSPTPLVAHWERPTGAAWYDGALWVHYDASDGGRLVSIDPASGAETARFAVGPGVSDIDTDGRALYLAGSTVDGAIEVRDPATGQILDALWSEAFHASLRGVAVVTPPGADRPEVWSENLASNELVVMVGGQVVATAALEGFGHNLGTRLQFADQRLTALIDNQLYFFDVVRPAP